MLSPVELQPHTSSIGFEPIMYPYAYTASLDAADFANSSNYLASGAARFEQALRIYHGRFGVCWVRPLPHTPIIYFLVTLTHD